MTQQNLAALFMDSAQTIRKYREELAALAPEIEERCGPLDELVEYIERQSGILLGGAAAAPVSDESQGTPPLS